MTDPSDTTGNELKKSSCGRFLSLQLPPTFSFWREYSPVCSFYSATLGQSSCQLKWRLFPSDKSLIQPYITSRLSFNLIGRRSYGNMCMYAGRLKDRRNCRAVLSSSHMLITAMQRIVRLPVIDSVALDRQRRLILIRRHSIGRSSTDTRKVARSRYRPKRASSNSVLRTRTAQIHRRSRGTNLPSTTSDARLNAGREARAGRRRERAHARLLSCVTFTWSRRLYESKRCASHVLLAFLPAADGLIFSRYNVAQERARF